MATELASVYVSLVPSARGIASQIASELGGPVQIAARQSGGDASQGFMSSFGGKAKVLAGVAAAGVAAAGAAIGVAAVKGFTDAVDAERSSDKLAASLGLTPAEAAAAAGTAASIYRGAWGDSLAEVNTAIASVVRQIPGMEDAANPALEGITTKVLDVATAFDQDLGQIARAVGTLMKTGMAPDAESALDLITKGFQGPVNAADDFLDTLNEYSTLFRNLGLDGQLATGLLTQGLAAGARDADKVADALKEFSIRAVDGSELTAEGFAMVGLNASEMAADIAAGGPRAEAALDKTLDKLRAIEDPVVRSQAAVALFGTQAEDLGDALFALDPSEAVNALGEVEGAAAAAGDTLNDNLGTKIESLKRRFLGGLSDLANQGIEAVAPFAERITSAFDEDGLAGALDEAGRVAREILPTIWDFFAGGGLIGRLARSIDWTEIPNIIREQLAPAGQALWQWIRDSLPPALEQFGLWLGGVLDWLVNVGAPAFRQWVRDTWAPGFWEWVKTSAGPLLLELGILLGRLVSWIVTDAVPVLAQQGALMLQAFWGWVTTTAVPWLQANLPKMWDAYVAWVTGTAWPWLAANVPNWLQSMWGWIITVAVPWVAGALMHISRAISEWFYLTFIPWLVTNYPQWAAAFTEWVTTTAIPWLLTKLVELQSAFGSWITDTALPWLRTKAGEWAAALVDWITTEGIPAARTKLGEWLGDVQSWAAGLPGQFRDMLISAGTDLVAGLWQGITDRWDGLVEDLRGLVDQLPSAVKEILGISSPSKVMAGLGQNIVEGLVAGMQVVAPKVAAWWKNFTEGLSNVPIGGAFKVFEDGSIATPAHDLRHGAGWFDSVSAPVQYRNSWHDAYAAGASTMVGFPQGGTPIVVNLDGRRVGDGIAPHQRRFAATSRRR